MKTIKIEGIATFSKNGFSFNSGLPSEETLVTEQNILLARMVSALTADCQVKKHS